MGETERNDKKKMSHILCYFHESYLSIQYLTPLSERIITHQGKSGEGIGMKDDVEEK